MMFQTFIDTANAPIFGIDCQGRVNEWNKKAAEITGFSRDEVLGKSLVQVHGFSSIDQVLETALKGEETENYEYTLYTKDGRRRDLLLNATTWRDVDGITIIGVIGVAQDITERKQIEGEKARVALELQTFIDTANAPIFGIDANGLVNEWNNKSAAITGFSREEVLGKNLVQDFITPEFQKSVKEVLDNALQGSETANFEFPLYTKDRRRVEVLLNATTRRDVDGAVIGVIGVGQDISERKQVEMEKTRVAQELQTFIDTANAPIFGIDANGLVNEWNNKAAAITGFSREEVLGRNLVQDFITKEYQVSVKEVQNNALQGHEAANFEFPLYTKDKRRVEVLLNATTRRDVSGNVVGVIGVGQDITERKQVEMEKTRVAKELQTFIDTANAPIFGIDANGLVNEWNNKSEAITGFARKEVLGKNLVQDFITEEYQKSVKEVLDNALKGRETANFEFPLYTKDQRRVEVLLNATTRRDVSGNVVGVLGVGQDITERKQVEMEKTRVAKELQTFIDTANAPIFGIDANGLVNEWNNKSAAITGFSREEVLGKNLVQDFITQEYQVSVKEVLDNALQGRETANFEFPLYTKDQRRVEVLLNATTRRDVSGNVVGVLGVGQDITERKQVEMEKTRVAQELQTFIDTANAPIFGIDANGLVNEWNNKSAAITGFSREEVLGRNLVQDFITKEYQVSVKEVLDNALQGRETANFEFPLYTKDQRRVDVLLNATTRRDVSGNVVGVLGVGQDITERKHVEMEKTRVAQELQTFIDTANAPIFGIDANGLVNEWNNKSAAITGFSRMEVLGKNLVQDFITKEYQVSVKEVLDNALQGRETANFEFPLYTKDERRVDVLLNATTRRDVSGNVVGVLGVGQDITERKQVEMEKTRVAKELQTFIDTANAPIFGIDANGLVNEWNNKSAAITGFSREEVLGKDLVQDFITQEYQVSVKEVLDNALQGRETANFEFPLYTKDQRRVDVLLNATTRRDVSGHVVGVLGVGQDITERKQVEMEKTRVAKELQTFIDTANAPIFGIDANGLVNEWNNKSAAITGFSRKEVLGKNLVQDFITEEYQVSVKEVLDNALQGREAANFEFPLYTKDQRRVDVLLNATTRRDVSGNLVGVLGVGQDITERKQVEMEKTRVAKELQTFIDTANAPIFGIDANGLVNEWNNKSAAITGFSREEVLGKNLVQDFITQEYQVSVKEVLDNALQGREAANFEFPLYTKDQRRVEVLLNATTRRDVSGNVVGVLGVGQDITERKQVEVEKTRVAQELQTFIDTANAPIFGIDANGLVNEWNNKSAAITGFSRREVLGKNLVQDFITEEYQKSVKEVLDNALQGRETANFEFPLYTKDQRRVEVLLNATTRRDVTGNVVGVLGVGQDITERKQVEVEKTRVAQELQTFIDTANAPIFGIDANGLVNEWNNKSAAITGFSREEVLGRNLVQDFITMEYQVSVKEVLDNALQGRETANFEFPLYTKDQRRVEVLLNATTRRDVCGNVVGVLGVGQDITERKQVEMEKTRVAKELQTFIDTANAPIFGIDASGLVNEWNNKSESITGFSREEVLGKNLVQDFITKEYQVSVKEVLDNALQGREAANFEFPLYTKNQRRVDVLLNATTRRDVSGNVVGVLGVGQDITERKQVEVEKTRVAQELQTFIDTANAPIFGIDANGLVNEWNNKSAAITGFSREEVLGKNLVQDFITKEYQVSVKEVLDNALQGRETANFEFPLYTKDQRRVDVLLNATTRRDVSGNVVGVLGVGQDITERKQVEVEKTRVAQELQTFIDTANAPIFGIDANGLVNEWNNKSAAITGFSREEVLGKNLVQDFITKEYQVSVKEVLDNALQGRETANFEFPLYTKDQRRVDVLLNATTRRDVSGNVVGVLGVGQDITERKQVEVEKTRVAQELQTFIDTANAPIFGIDANGLVNEWNNKSAAITGFSRKEVLGKNLVQDFITKEYQVSVKEVLDNALQGRETANFEFPLYTKDQRRVDVLLNATTRRDVSGNVVGVLGVGQDITERKQVEVEKTRVAQELQTFIDTANAPIFGIDAFGSVNEWNNKSAAITGFSREEVLGKNLVQDFITQEYQVTVKEVLDNALQGRETANFEFPLYTKDQCRVEVLLNATTRRDVSGNVVGVIGVGQDITERKQVEVEKTRVAQELQTFIDTANAPIFGIDANGLVNEWNNKSAAITGFSREEVLGRNLVQDFITNEYQVSVKEVLDNALQGRETANFEFPLYTKDKRRVEVLLNATTRRDVTGNVVGVLGVGQDITERKQVEVEKTRVAKELQTFIDTANAPIFGIDANGLVNEWNNKSAAITGFSCEEVLGRNLVQDFITKEYQVSVKEVLDNALQGRETANFEFPLYTKDQRRVEVLLNATTRRDVSGNVVGVIGVGQDITERKQVEMEKTRVAQELQTFIDTANAPIFGIDANGMVNEWNNKSAAITGFSRKEVLGRNLVQDFITKEYQVSVKEVLDNALQGRETANFEFPLYTKDQRRVDVLLNATTRRDVSGNVVGVLGVGQDITERKQVEVEKTRVAQELQTFIDTANAPIFGIDANGLVNEWNNKAAEITGFSKQEVLGKDLVRAYITEEFRASVKQVWDKALQGMETANFEFPLFTKNERRVEVLLNATTRRDVTGAIVGVIGVGQDITERKHAEEEKARVALELQTFIDTANAPIFGIDAKGLVNEWNNKAADITGFSREEVLGKDLVEVYISADFRASVNQVLDNALQGQETANFEFPLYTKDQRRVEVLLNATTRRDVSGNVVGVLGVGQDITERKQVEVEKTRVAQELQTFIDTANAPIFGIDANGLVNEWNNKAAAITGFAREEVLGKNLVQDFITKEYQVSVSEVLDNALQGRETANFEFPLYTKDQRRVEVLLNATTRRDVRGDVVGMLGVGQDITERKQVEVEKTRVAQELQTFIDTANAPIFGIDANGLVNEWNNKAAAITGFSRQEVLGRNLVQDFITKEYQVSVKEVLDNALQGREAANFEFPLYTKDQRRVEVLLNATTRRDVSGNVVGVLGVGQDITERKQVEVEKTRVAQELQTFIDTANAPIFGIDANGLVNEWNNKSAAITGFSRQEVLGKNLVEVYITEEYRASVKMVLDNALKGQETANFEFPLFTADKRRVEVLLNATTRRDVSGNVVGVLGVGQDITERKQVEEEKTRVAQELQTFIDTANAPIFGIDADGLVNEWNNKSAEITGFSKHEVMGKDLVEVYITEEFRASVREVLDNALQGIEKSNFEFPLFTKDQRRVEVLLNATTRRDVTGVIVGVIGVGQDITEMRRLMEQETLLFQAQAANDAKSQFLATMSHEMRTPLNVIMGMNQLVMDTPLTDEQKKFTQQIKTSSESLLVLINDILDLTKIEAGKLELVTVDFDLRTALEDAVDSVAGRAMAKGLEICCYLDPSAPTRIMGDPDRLRQIFLNLFSNGIKFTAAGQVYVVVEVEEITATHQTFRFKVYDSGIGISAEGQKKLFNRFSQVDSSTTRTYGGTGLGLAISKQFAELMDGSMGVQSEVGKGSLFWFTAVFKRATSPSSGFPPLARSITALLVAQNETLRNKLLRYLEAFGLHPVCVSSFDEMEAVCRGREFDLTIASCEIIGGLGFQLDAPQGAAGQRSPDLDRLHATMRTLAGVLQRRPRMQCIVLCPITQLSHCAAYKDACGFTLISRPVRLACFHQALLDAAEYAGPCSGAPDPRRCDAAGAAAAAGSAAQARALAVEMADRASSAESAAAARAEAVEAAVSDGSRRMRVLVVDDDAGQRMVVKMMLIREGYEVDVAEDGAQALKATARVVYDAVLMDGFMPIKTGWDATKEIREREAAAGGSVGAGLIIIGVTGATTSEDARKCLDCGMTDFIPKPIDRASINSKIRYWTERYGRSGTPASGAAPSPELDLPAASAAGAKAGAAPGSAAPAARKAAAAPPAQVLVMTDAGQRTVLRAMLKQLGGVEVDVAADAAAAAALAAGKAYDLYLLDADLPPAAGTGGAAAGALAAQLRAIEAAAGRREAPLVGISGRAAEDVGLVEAGFAAILTRPLQRDAVHSTLRSWLRSDTAAGGRAEAGAAGAGGGEGLEGGGGRGSSLRILIVEDHWANRKLLESMLRQKGYDSECVENGLEAVQITAAKEFDLVLMDCNMPIMDGWQATEKIRQRGGLNHRTPIVAVTANAMKGDREKCLAAGMDDYLSKPVDRKLLYEAISKWTPTHVPVAPSSTQDA